MTRNARSSVNAALFVFSVTVPFLFMELVIRQFFPQVTLYPRYIESEDYPIAFSPNSKLIHSQGTLWKFVYTTNSTGHRGPDVPAFQTDLPVRVVVLGDSFTFGMGVNDFEEYPSQLGKRLGSRFYVVNGGMGGFGIDSEIKWYFKTGAAYKPRVVILQFSANDPSDPGENPVTRIVGSRFEFRPYSVRKSRWQSLLSGSAILQKSHLYSVLRVVYSAFALPDRTGAVVANGAARITRIQQDYISLLRLFAETLKNDDVLLLMVSVTHSHGNEDYHYDIDDFPLIKAAIEELDKGGFVKFVPLPLDEMRRHPRSPEPQHQWSAAHHAIVADKVADVFRTTAIPAAH